MMKITLRETGKTYILPMNAEEMAALKATVGLEADEIVDHYSFEIDPDEKYYLAMPYYGDLDEINELADWLEAIAARGEEKTLDAVLKSKREKNIKKAIESIFDRNYVFFPNMTKAEYAQKCHDEWNELSYLDESEENLTKSDWTKIFENEYENEAIAVNGGILVFQLKEYY